MNPSPEQARLPAPPSPTLLAHLRAQARGGVLSYRDFIAAALYAPELGYYSRPAALRVGRRSDADFYTASSLGGGVFGRIIRAAAVNMLAPDSPQDHTLVEIAAEPGVGAFGNDAGPFGALTTHRLGDALAPPARAVVFANEWLDAQPFHRWVYRHGAWRELGVRVDGPALTETELPEWSSAAEALRDDLPNEAPEEYRLDLSLDAEASLRELAAAPWRGALILADYGLDWLTLARERPAGTARAYRRQQVSGNLLDCPGEQDLTCHVCWDRLEKILRDHGFSEVRVERQEAFFLGRAMGEIEAILGQAEEFSPARQTLLELLHPAHLGHKFQILSARRV
jgi:SAM-dependent MidA family methyltransferase